MKTAAIAIMLALLISLSARAEEVAVNGGLIVLSDTPAITEVEIVRETAQEVTGDVSEEQANKYKAILEHARKIDYIALQEVIYNESACCLCGHDVNTAVAETVLNRVLSDEFPDTIYDVCHQKGQFVCREYTADEKQQALIDDAISTVKNGLSVLPDYDYIYFATKKQSCAKDHVRIGGDRKWSYMYFGRGK